MCMLQLQEDQRRKQPVLRRKFLKSTVRKGYSILPHPRHLYALKEGDQLCKEPQELEIKYLENLGAKGVTKDCLLPDS